MDKRIKEALNKIEIPKELHERSKLGVLQAKSSKRKGKVNKLIISLVASTFFAFSAVGATYIPNLNRLVE